MKILIFSWRDIKNPKAGGAEIFTHEVAKRWVRSGNQVSVIAAKFPNAKDKEILDGVKIFRPAKLRGLDPIAYLLFLKNNILFYQRNLRDKFDLVIDQVHGPPLFCKFYVREKIIAFPHEVAKEIWFYELTFPFSLIGFIIESLYLSLYRNVPFITVSSSTTKDLKRAGIKKVSITSEGISFRPLKSLPRKTNYPLIVCLGRLTKMKRIEEALRAFKIITHSSPKAKLLIIGKGEKKYEKKLKGLTKKLEIEKQVKFTGFISDKKKIEFLKKAWMLVSTSVREGWGIVVIEAAACGTPSVVYGVPGLVDSVQDKKTGLICKKNSPKELARNLVRLTKNKKLRLNLSQNALEYSRQFTWKKSAQETMDILEKLIS